MTAEVNFHPDGLYDADLVRVIKRLPSVARRWQPEDMSWRVDHYGANRLAYETAALGCLITGLVSERRKQQRTGDMCCSSRCRQRAYHRRRRAAK